MMMVPPGCNLCRGPEVYHSYVLSYAVEDIASCSECGSSIGIASVNESAPPKRTSRKIISINENETDAESVPYIEKLEYEIETFGGDVQQTLGSLGGHSAPTKRKTNIKHFDDL